MSRIGRMPIAIPAGTTVTVADENVVTVQGKLGTLTQKFSSRMSIKVEGNEVIVTRPTDEKEDKSLHALTVVGFGRSLAADNRCGLTNLLLVDTLYDKGVKYANETVRRKAGKAGKGK